MINAEQARKRAIEAPYRRSGLEPTMEQVEAAILHETGYGLNSALVNINDGVYDKALELLNEAGYKLYPTGARFAYVVAWL